MNALLFNSYPFLFIFLPITFFLYFFLARLKRYTLALSSLVIASLVFYAYWDIRYLPLLLGSIIFNYIAASFLNKKRRKRYLVAAISVDLALLGYFKYTGFFLSTIQEIFDVSVVIPSIVLPLGISFFTFTQIAYLVDAYRGETKQYNFLTYSLFVTVFPHLIAGPVLYHKDMIPQFLKEENFRINERNIAAGLSIFSIGLFKKVAIADTLSPWVEAAFSHAELLSFIEAWCGAIAYTFQLYFDFSGYSEMAIGLGLLFNLKLPVNFSLPYRATSAIEFWRRWHMTLCAFLKNYVYIPLGGGRNGEGRKLRNLFITMLVSGLWHGAGWTFILWGGLHGVFLVVNHLWRKTGFCLPKAVNWSVTFLAVTIAWVFFRAGSIGEAIHFLEAMFNVHNIVLPMGGRYEALFVPLQKFGITFGSLTHWGSKREIYLLGICFITLLYSTSIPQRLENFKPNWKFLIVSSLAFSIALLKMYTIKSEFIYFQF